MSDELRPCACGKIPKLERVDWSGGGLDIPRIRFVCTHATGWHYEEKYRHEIGRYDDIRAEAMANAVTEWNTRAEPPAPSSDEVAELPKSLELHLQDIDADGWHYAVKVIRAHIAALESEVKEQCRLHGIGSEREAKQMSEIQSLEADNKRLREALEFYAKGEHWQKIEYNYAMLEVAIEFGEHAKQALAQVDGKAGE